jgi:hypothetical protein
VTYETVMNSFVIVPGSIYFHNIVSFVIAPLFIYLVLSFAVTESSLTEMDLLEDLISWSEINKLWRSRG